jgi:hypothetical protein
MIAIMRISLDVVKAFAVEGRRADVGEPCVGANLESRVEGKQ